MRKPTASALIPGFFATIFLLAPGLALALGLGQIQSNTHIGQNLNARIPILAASPGVLQGLTVGLAEPEAYRRAGVQESDFLFGLQFKIEQGANGPYVLVTSSQPVRLPFLNILVHAQWSSGDVTRQYTLLLNPPVFASARSQQAQSPAPVAAPTTPQRQTPIARPKPPPTQPVSSPPRHYVAPNPAPNASPNPAPTARPGVYGPIQRGATLWGIANNVRSGASVNQMMIALYRANPQAFSGNIDRLRAGATLRIPSRAEVRQISRTEANAEVARQVRNWKTAQTGTESAVAKTSAPDHFLANQGGSADKMAAKVAGKPAGGTSATQAGEVVLTAPKVTQPLAAGGVAAAGKGVNDSGQATGPATAAAAVVAAAGVHNGGGASKDGSGKAAAVPAASAGGPAKLHNAELASLAAAGAAAKRTKPSAHNPHSAAPKAQPVKAVGKTGRSHAPAATKGGGLSATVWDWLTSPKGWVVIALIVLFLIFLIFLFTRRRQRHERNLMALAASASGADAPVRQREEPALGGFALATAGGPAIAAFGNAPFVPVHSGVEPRQEPETESREDAVRPDALDEADLFASHGDYAGAAGVLSEALEAAPERNDLRLRRLELLFAADDGPAFRDAAEDLHRRVPATDAGWRSVAVMGRELLPDDPLFAEGETDADSLESTLVGEQVGDQVGDQEAEATDFEFELDQLNEEEPVESLQPDEFERTLGELSTMIETYMPESGEGPVELHLPPEEPNDSPTLAVNEDPTLAVASEALAEEPREEAQESSRLELAQAYLDMEDRESARATLEGLVAEGDGPERERARGMLAAMDGESGEEFAAEPDADLASEEGSKAPFEVDESGTAMDLARAYLELGDRESARDILEEILDDGSEPQREKARELLESLS